VEHGIDGTVHPEELRHVVVHERETGMADEMGDILRPPGREVVDADDLVAPPDERITEM
jgi:hypothetical protein